MHQFGLSQVVATLGTAVTRDHLEQLFRHVPEVIFCFDGDAAGRRAAWKALEISLPVIEGNRQVRFAFLPDGHDPDTAIRAYGAEGFFTAAQMFGLSEYLIDVLKADMDLASGDGRARLIAKAKPYLLQIPDITHRANGVVLLARLTRFDEDLLRRELGFATGRPQFTAARPSALTRYTSRALEDQALALLLQRPDLAGCLVDKDAEFIGAELTECALLLSVWSELRRAAAGSTAMLLERWRGQADEERLATLATTELNVAEPAQERELQDAVAALVRRAEDERFRRINAIPLAQWTEEQKQIVRGYKRGR